MLLVTLSMFKTKIFEEKCENRWSFLEISIHSGNFEMFTIIETKDNAKLNRFLI
jgi:hypothetical protein